MPRVGLVHWKEDEIQPLLARLRAAGFTAAHVPVTPPTLLRTFEKRRPAALVIDLSRLPSQGRDVALFLRSRKATRQIPLVFVAGEAEKVEQIRRQLPDAEYTSWTKIGTALRRALARPPVDPVVPGSALAGYSGTPLPKKLGIKPGSVVALVRAPADFHKTLGELPEGARLRRGVRGAYGLTMWFVRSKIELTRGMRTMAPRAADAPMWIIWPKKASGVQTDVSEPVVRQAGLAAGLVDYKICAVDATWSGLLFRRRKTQKLNRR